MPYLRFVVKVCSAFVISLACWECLLRLIAEQPLPYHHDPKLGWMPVPLSRCMDAREGYAHFSFNELGFRDDPVGVKAPGEFRVLCLGDSYVEGGGMGPAQTYPRRLQCLLRGRPGVPRLVRVLNAARAGTTVAFSVGLSDAYKSLFQPDLVIIMVRDGWGDLLDPVQEVHYAATGAGFKVKTDWHWEHMSKAQRLAVRMHLRDLAVVHYGLRHLIDIREASQRASRAAGKSDASTRLAAIDWTVAELAHRYPHLVLVHMPYTAGTHDGLAPVSPDELRLADACKGCGVPLVRMRGEIERDAAAGGMPPFGFANTLPWEGHPNAHGHDLVARALARMLTAPDVLPGWTLLSARDGRSAASHAAAGMVGSRGPSARCPRGKVNPTMLLTDKRLNKGHRAAYSDSGRLLCRTACKGRL